MEDGGRRALSRAGPARFEGRNDPMTARQQVYLFLTACYARPQAPPSRRGSRCSDPKRCRADSDSDVSRLGNFGSEIAQLFHF
ncbi:hypothetical protein X945_5776 [Burkholderia pseudomallei ABCPW 107]|nr:hypothetical protein X945_5776 [Burkholderia pseudomallei ABCPW 107]